MRVCEYTRTRAQCTDPCVSGVMLCQPLTHSLETGSLSEPGAEQTASKPCCSCSCLFSTGHSRGVAGLLCESSCLCSKCSHHLLQPHRVQLTDSPIGLVALLLLWQSSWQRQCKKRRVTWVHSLREMQLETYLEMCLLGDSSASQLDCRFQLSHRFVL